MRLALRDSGKSRIGSKNTCRARWYPSASTVYAPGAGSVTVAVFPSGTACTPRASGRTVSSRTGCAQRMCSVTGSSASKPRKAASSVRSSGR